MDEQSTDGRGMRAERGGTGTGRRSSELDSVRRELSHPAWGQQMSSESAFTAFTRLPPGTPPGHQGQVSGQTGQPGQGSDGSDVTLCGAAAVTRAVQPLLTTAQRFSGSTTPAHRTESGERRSAGGYSMCCESTNLQCISSFYRVK